MTTESDRELLELAAKAAGYQVDQRASFATWRDRRRLALLNPQGGHTLWNADEDDGDAFRLEAVLRLDTTWGTASVTVGGCTERYSHGDDPREAKRRAITRAAASIGRGEG